MISHLSKETHHYQCDGALSEPMVGFVERHIYSMDAVRPISFTVVFDYSDHLCTIPSSCSIHHRYTRSINNGLIRKCFTNWRMSYVFYTLVQNNGIIGILLTTHYRQAEILGPPSSKNSSILDFESPFSLAKNRHPDFPRACLSLGLTTTTQTHSSLPCKARTS
jgi:hypothetical protein